MTYVYLLLALRVHPSQWQRSNPKGTIWIQPLGTCQILLQTRQKSRSMSLKRSSAFAKPTMERGCIECGGMATRVMMTRGSQPTISQEMLCGDTTYEWDSRSETNSMLCLREY
jgi:hypothetical protein